MEVPLRLLTVLALVVAFAAAARPAPAHPSLQGDPSASVDPFIGTDGNGHTFPGADVPFGMVQFSPVSVGGGPGGYRYSEQRLRGFALTRLSGAGCTNYGDVPMLPVAGPPSISPAATRGGFDVGYSHRAEAAEPGSYSVGLDSGIDAALTTTTRTGLGIFTFPPGDAHGTVLVDPSGGANTRAATIELVGREGVVGSATSSAFGGACGHPRSSYTVYFALRFQHPFADFGVWSGDRLVRGGRRAAGARAGAYLSFDTNGEPVRVQAAVSFVSIGGARANLAAEASSWSFDTVRARARARWRQLLDRVRVRGGTSSARTVFYTALYHALLQPSVFSDANGEYRGESGRIEHANGYTQYSNISGWDLYRSEMPLLAMLAPQQASDIVRSLLADAAETGRLPRWPLANVETRLMTGDPSDAIIADAYAFGARSFDASAALQQMLLGAALPQAPNTDAAGDPSYVERPGLDRYLALGFVPGAPATTLEYAIADFAVAQLAGALGDTQDAATFLDRSGNWRQTFDAQTGFVEPRRGNGVFPAHLDPTSGVGFVEGNAWQYTLMVPQDMRDLLSAMGPSSAVVTRLDRFFTRLNAGPSAPHAWLGNEPSFGAPYAYLWLGAPWRSEAVVRRALTTLFAPRPSGLPGNDDLGAMSSWYVWSALGLYPAIPGYPGLAIVSPLFPQATIALPRGGTLAIDAPGAPSAEYVRTLELDGHPYDSSWLALATIAAGGRLDFGLGPRPSRWATGAAGTPPSFPPPPPGS